MRIDLHTHSCVSDGTDTPAEMVAAAAAAGLDVVGLCDHDTFDGLTAASAAAQEAGIRLLPGIEISTVQDGRGVHLLGYGCRPDDPALSAELAVVRHGRQARIPAMLAALAGIGLPIEDDLLAAMVGESPSIGRPHLADAMVAKGYVTDRSEAFARYLDAGRPGYVRRYATPLELGLDLVRGAGGVAVIAHPWGRGAREVLTGPALARLASEHGLDGIEVDHSDHSAADRGALRGLADRLGLLATGSSDYHGTGKTNHPLGLNTTAAEVFDELRRRIAQRAR